MTEPAVAMTDRRPSRLGRASIAAVVVNVGGSAMRLVLQIVLARSLGATDYGRFVLGRSWGELLGRFPNRGYEATAVKELPRYERVGRPDLFRGFVRTSWRVTASGAAALAIVSVAVYAVASDSPDHAILLGLALTAPMALAWLARSMLQGHHRFVVGSSLIELLQPLLFGASIAVLWAVDRLTALTALTTWIVTMGIVAAVGHLVMRHGYSAELAAAPAAYDRSGWQTIRRPLYASQLALVVLDNADILIVGALLSRGQVAAYAVATRLAVLGRIIVAGVQSVAASHLAEAASTQDWRETQRIVDRSLRVCALPTVAITIAAAVLAEPLVAVFGAEYDTAVVLLRILLIGNLVNSVTGPSGYVVSLSGLERIYARVMWAAAAATLLGVTVCAAWFGAAGAAWAVTSIMVAWNLALLVIARQRLGVRCWVRPATFRAAA